MPSVWQCLQLSPCSALAGHQPDILASSGPHARKNAVKLEHISRRKGWGVGRRTAICPVGERASTDAASSFLEEWDGWQKWLICRFWCNRGKKTPQEVRVMLVLAALGRRKVETEVPFGGDIPRG